MGARGTFRRLLADPVLTLATAFTVALTMVLLAAGPIYAEAISTGALRRSLNDAPVSSRSITITARSDPSAGPGLDELVTASLDDAIGDVGYQLTRTITSGETFGLPSSSPDGSTVDIARFVWASGIAQHTTLVAGSWPDDGGGQTVDVAVSERAAAELGLEIGSTLTLDPTSGAAGPATVRIVGHYTVDDANDAYWVGVDRVATGLSERGGFRTIAMVSTPQPLLTGLSARLQLRWSAVPDLSAVDLDLVNSLSRRIASLDERLIERYGSVDGQPAASSPFQVATIAPRLLAEDGQALTVAVSAVIAVIFQLAALAGYALALVAGLGVEARTAESSLLRARGASARQLLIMAILDAAVIALPLAVVAPIVAGRLLRLFDEFGPTASIGLVLDPRPALGSYLVVAAASLVIVAILATPAYRTARAIEAPKRRGSRRRVSTVLQRSGIDVAVLVLAAIAYWQLVTLDDGRTATVRGRFGVDPLLIVAPTFGLVAGSLLALRLLPALARLVERLTAGGRSLAPALAGWQLARRPQRYTRAGLLLILAIAVGTFASIYDATWSTSQTAQAAHEVGTDARVMPNRRTGDSVRDLNLERALETVTGVDEASPVLMQPIDLPGTDRPAVLLAVDAGQPAVIVDDAVDRERLVAALAELAARRPVVPAIELPGQPTSLELRADLDDPPPPPPPEPEPEEDNPDEESPADEEEDPDGEPAEESEEQIEEPVEEVEEIDWPPYTAALSVLVRDGSGVLHRIELGTIASDVSSLTVDLTTSIDGTPTPPVYPLALVDLQLIAPTPPPPGREVELQLGPIVAIGADESDRQPIDLTDRVLVASTTGLGFPQRPASAMATMDGASGRIGLTLETGASAPPVPIDFRLRPSGPVTGGGALPVVATRAWLESTGTEVGEVVAVDLSTATTTEAEIVAAVDAIPTVDPNADDGLLVDLATLQASSLATRSTPRSASEYWLDLGPDADLTADAFTSAPLESVEAILTVDRRAELLSSPPALGALGALTLGFIAAGIFAVAGFVATVVVSGRERQGEIALLRALGLTRRQQRVWLIAEQVALVTAGLIVGVAIGVGLAAIVLPVVSLAQDGGEVFPAVTVVYPVWRIAGLAAVVAAGLLVGATIAPALGWRGSVGSVLRAGGDR